MFDNPLVITVNSVAKNTAKINQDGYGSEYLLKSSTDEYRVKIRNQKEQRGADGFQFDRHNVEVTHLVYATDTVPAKKRVVSITLRNAYDDTIVDVQRFVAGVLAVIDSDAVADLMGWQS